MSKDSTPFKINSRIKKENTAIVNIDNTSNVSEIVENLSINSEHEWISVKEKLIYQLEIDANARLEIMKLLHKIKTYSLYKFGGYEYFQDFLSDIHNFNYGLTQVNVLIRIQQAFLEDKITKEELETKSLRYLEEKIKNFSRSYKKNISGDMKLIFTKVKVFLNDLELIACFQDKSKKKQIEKIVTQLVAENKERFLSILDKEEFNE